MEGNSKSTSALNGRTKKLALAGGGAVVVLTLILQSETARAVLVEMAQRSSNALVLALVLVVAMLLVDRRLAQFVGWGRQLAAASERQAAAIEQLTGRDDQRAREQDIVLNHLANSTDELLAIQKTLRDDVAQINRRLPA